MNGYSTYQYKTVNNLNSQAFDDVILPSTKRQCLRTDSNGFILGITDANGVLQSDGDANYSFGPLDIDHIELSIHDEILKTNSTGAIEGVTPSDGLLTCSSSTYSFDNSIPLQVANNTSDIVDNTTDIATNTTDIATNTTGIAHILDGTTTFTNLKFNSMNGNHIVEFDSTSRNLKENLNTTLDPAGNLSVTSISSSDYINSTFTLSSRVLLSDTLQGITQSTVSNTTLSFLDATSSIQSQLTTNAGNTTAVTNAVTALTSGTFPFSGFYFPSMSGNQLLYFNTSTKLLTENSNASLSAGGNLSVNNNAISSFPSVSAYALISNSSKQIVQSSVTKTLLEGFDTRITNNTSNITDLDTRVDALESESLYFWYSAQMGYTTSGQSFTTTYVEFDRESIESNTPYVYCFPTTGSTINTLYPNIWFASANKCKVYFGVAGTYEYTFTYSIYGEDKYYVIAQINSTTINLSTLGIYGFKINSNVVQGLVTITNVSVWTSGYTFASTGDYLDFFVKSIDDEGVVNGLQLTIRKVS